MGALAPACTGRLTAEATYKSKSWMTGQRAAGKNAGAITLALKALGVYVAEVTVQQWLGRHGLVSMALLTKHARRTYRNPRWLARHVTAGRCRAWIARRARVSEQTIDMAMDFLHLPYVRPLPIPVVAKRLLERRTWIAGRLALGFTDFQIAGVLSRVAYSKGFAWRCTATHVVRARQHFGFLSVRERASQERSRLFKEFSQFLRLHHKVVANLHPEYARILRRCFLRSRPVALTTLMKEFRSKTRAGMSALRLRALAAFSTYCPIPKYLWPVTIHPQGGKKRGEPCRRFALLQPAE